MGDPAMPDVYAALLEEAVAAQAEADAAEREANAAWWAAAGEEFRKRQGQRRQRPPRERAGTIDFQMVANIALSEIDLWIASVFDAVSFAAGPEPRMTEQQLAAHGLTRDRSQDIALLTRQGVTFALNLRSSLGAWRCVDGPPAAGLDVVGLVAAATGWSAGRTTRRLCRWCGVEAPTVEVQR